MRYSCLFPLIVLIVILTVGFGLTASAESSVNMFL